MEIGEALKRCLMLSEVVVPPYAGREVDLHLTLRLDPTTDEGNTVIDWYNDLEPAEPIEI